MEMDVSQLGFQELNNELRASADENITLKGCIGQRFIGTGMKMQKITVGGIAGNALGAYLEAATLATAITRITPLGLETFGTSYVNANLDNTSNIETKDVLALIGETANGIKLELQAAALKAVLKGNAPILSFAVNV